MCGRFVIRRLDLLYIGLGTAPFCRIQPMSPAPLGPDGRHLPRKASIQISLNLSAASRRFPFLPLLSPARLTRSTTSRLFPPHLDTVPLPAMAPILLLLESTVGSFADQPSALLPINRRRRTPAMNPGTERRRRCFCAA
jgi:hypothetical protein